MEWGVIALGFAGLAVAALTLVLTYRERVAALRGALYAKQIEVYGLLLHALSELHEETIAFTTEKGFRLHGESRRELRVAVREQYAQVAKLMVRNAVYLPQTVGDSVHEYSRVFKAISAPPEVESQYPPELVRAADPQMDLSNAFVKVWEAMARQLGTEPLSRQALKIFGRSPSE